MGTSPSEPIRLACSFRANGRCLPGLGCLQLSHSRWPCMCSGRGPQRLTLLACPRNSQRTRSERSGRGPQRLTILTAPALWGVAALAACAVARPCSVPPRGPSSATGNRAGHASARSLHPTSPWAPLERWQRAVCPLSVCIARRPAQGLRGGHRASSDP